MVRHAQDAPTRHHPSPLTGAVAYREAIAAQILAALEREYPNHLVHLLNGDADARPPRALHPAFSGSFDWHSSVHGHWALARLLRLHPDASFAAPARERLERSLSVESLRGEIEYLEAPGRAGFERPYGLAWVLKLAAEVVEEPSWSAALGPLEELAAQRLIALMDRLAVPVRGGEHAQTAFALALAWDWARARGRADRAGTFAEHARRFYAADRDAPIAYEPSAFDFLSPVAAEADLLRRVLDAPAFASWLAVFLPNLESEAAERWLTPVVSVDRTDGKLAHADGLNLSRSWMLAGIAAALPSGHARARLEQAARRHREASLASAVTEHEAGSHWLGSFAVYALTEP